MDPVRFLSNHSTGKMGYAIAARAAMRGADATLVSGPTALDTPHGVTRVDIVSARDMYDAVTSRAPEQDFIIKAAAVGDYRPAQTRMKSSKKGDGEMNIELTRNPDILPHSARTKSRDSCCAALRWRRRTFSITPRASCAARTAICL